MLCRPLSLSIDCDLCLDRDYLRLQEDLIRKLKMSYFQRRLLCENLACPEPIDPSVSAPSSVTWPSPECSTTFIRWILPFANSFHHRPNFSLDCYKAFGDLRVFISLEAGPGALRLFLILNMSFKPNILVLLTPPHIITIKRNKLRSSTIRKCSSCG